VASRPTSSSCPGGCRAGGHRRRWHVVTHKPAILIGRRSGNHDDTGVSEMTLVPSPRTRRTKVKICGVASAGTVGGVVSSTLKETAVPGTQPRNRSAVMLWHETLASGVARRDGGEEGRLVDVHLGKTIDPEGGPSKSTASSTSPANDRDSWEGCEIGHRIHDLRLHRGFARTQGGPRIRRCTM